MHFPDCPAATPDPEWGCPPPSHLSESWGVDVLTSVSGHEDRSKLYRMEEEEEEVGALTSQSLGGQPAHRREKEHCLFKPLSQGGSYYNSQPFPCKPVDLVLGGHQSSPDCFLI